MIDFTLRLDAIYNDELENKIMSPDDDDFNGVMLGCCEEQTYIDYTTEDDESLEVVLTRLVKKLKQLDIKVLSISIDPATLDLN